MEVARALEVNGMFFRARNESWVVSTEVHTGVQARRPLQRLEMGASVAEVARAFEVDAMFFPARNEPWVVSTEVHTGVQARDRKSTRLNSSHGYISYAVFCLKKKKNKIEKHRRDPKMTDVL